MQAELLAREPLDLAALAALVMLAALLYSSGGHAGASAYGRRPILRRSAARSIRQLWPILAAGSWRR